MAEILSKKIVFQRDVGADPIQKALRPWQTVKIAIGVNATRNDGSPISAQVVRLIATQDCHIKFGDADVTATTEDMLLKDGVAEYFALSPKKYISVIRTGLEYSPPVYETPSPSVSASESPSASPSESPSVSPSEEEPLDFLYITILQ